jgi:hypothetical protein
MAADKAEPLAVTVTPSSSSDEGITVPASMLLRTTILAGLAGVAGGALVGLVLGALIWRRPKRNPRRR